MHGRVLCVGGDLVVGRRPLLQQGSSPYKWATCTDSGADARGVCGCLAVVRARHGQTLVQLEVR
jgi:hypothetical protein